MPAPDDATVGALPVGVVVLGADGRVAVWNAAAEHLTGWAAGDVLGNHVGDSVALDGPTAARVLAEVRAGRAFAGRLPAEVPTGRSLYFRAAPAPDGGLVGVLQDVADTTAEDEAFGLLDALWETAPVGLIYFDTRLRYRRVNGTVLDRHGGSNDDRLGRTLEEVHGALGARMADVLREVLADGSPRHDVPVEGRLWHGRGDPGEWRVFAYPVQMRGDIVGVGMVVVDVTVAERTRRELAGVAAQRQSLLNRYQSLVEATSAAVWTRAADGRAVVDAPGLRAITGQGEEQMRGWGHLDAVHPAHRPGIAEAWRAAVAADPPAAFTRTYRLRTVSGQYRWFRTRAVPVVAEGRAAEWVGTETDVDDALRARDRLDVLATATYAMKATLQPEAQLRALADAVVPAFADGCRVYLLDTADRRRLAGVSGRRLVTRLAPGLPEGAPSGERFVVGPDHPIARCVRAAAPLLVDLAADPEPAWSTGMLRAGWTRATGATSMLVTPVVRDTRVVAVLIFVSAGDRPAYTEDDRAIVGELAERAGAALAAAEASRHDRQVSVALQAAMLTEAPEHPGVEVQVRYLPAVAQMQVGGDWYDAFPLPGGDLAVGVGDVVGHDLPAAVAMGQLRSMLRALAHDSGGAPSDVVTRLDRVARGLGVTRFATLIYGRIARVDGRTTFRWANAGHPPPILVDAAAARPLPGVDVVLGVGRGAARRDHEVDLPAGSTLLLYTDGLVERRDDSDPTAALLDLARAGADLPLASFCDHVVRGSVADTGDDVALLALRPLL